MLCCNTHRAASSSSFSTGEMEKKQSRRKSQEHPTVCAVLAVPAEPSCGDAAFQEQCWIYTHKPQNRGFFVTTKMIWSSEKQGCRRKFPILVRPIDTTGTNLHAAKYLLHNSKSYLQHFSFDFSAENLPCLSSQLSNSLTMNISKHNRGKRHVICIGVGMMSRELGTSLSRLFFLFSH